MKVAFDVTPLAGVRTGIGQATAGMYAGLRELGGPELLPYLLGSPRHRRAVPPGSRLVPLPTGAALRLWARGEHPRIDPLLRGADVLHATNFLTPPSRRPTLVTVYDLTFLTHPDTVAPHARRFGPNLRRAIDRGAHLHAATRVGAAEIERLLGPGLLQRLHVVPFGVPPLPTAAVVPGPPYVLALGRVEPRKDLPTLVAAMGEVMRTRPELRLRIAGPDGSGSSALAAAVEVLPPSVRSRVDRLGWVDDLTAASLVRGATVLAYPSLEEGFGFPPLQAMTVGTPVLASDVPVIAEVTAGAALLAPPRDVAAWVDGLARLTDDDALRVSLADRGRARTAAGDWAATAAGLHAAYVACSTDR